MASSDPHAHDFSVVTTTEDEAVVVAVTGQADLHTAPELRGAIGQAIDDGCRSVVVDLSRTTFIDSMTLGVLLGALKRLVAVDGRLVIACPDRHVRRVFEITSLDRVLTLTASLEEARTVIHAGKGGV